MAVLWLRFLTEIDRDTDEIPAELLENPETCKALKILEKSAYNDEELRAYEYYWDAVYNERGAIRHGYKQGLSQGLAEGRAEGLSQGRAEGRAEGHAEGMKAANRENARKMKQKGIADDVIAEVTGLSIEEIQQL